MDRNYTIRFVGPTRQGPCLKFVRLNHHISAMTDVTCSDSVSCTIYVVAS